MIITTFFGLNNNFSDFLPLHLSFSDGYPDAHEPFARAFPFPISMVLYFLSYLPLVSLIGRHN
jgi:hypothetical protein